MKTRSFIIIAALIIVVCQTSGAQSTGNPVIDQLLSAWSPREYTTSPVTDQQIDLIIKCGIKAPSARNNQPWHFTVVQNEALVKEIIPTAVSGNVLFVISGKESETGTTPDFDCGLAAQNMFIAASSLGLGGRLYGSPVATAIKLRDSLQIPEGFKPVIILRTGSIEKAADASSGASPRKAPGEIVNYVK
ncbi:MAG: nitroreductase family protein [Bacteroidales bacterium]|nr:nitroreductase family protein [Bacteroidales bacterium]MBN2632506.1 nitroreductase family protein [Bacteroidales bacterium]